MTNHQMSVNGNSHCNGQTSSHKWGIPIYCHSASPQRRVLSEDHSGPSHHQYNKCYNWGFSYGTNIGAHPVCAVCLGTQAHNVYVCERSKTWDRCHTMLAERDKNKLYGLAANTTTDISALDMVKPLMELMLVLKHKKLRLLTPYCLDI